MTVLTTRRMLVLRRLLVAAGVLVALSVPVALGLAYVLVRTAPAWWRSALSESEDAALRAQRIEADAATVFTEVRPVDPDAAPDVGYRSTPWRIALAEDDASAWLTARFPAWLADETGDGIPESLQELQVRFQDGGARVGVRYTDATVGERVVSATLAPVVRDDGSVWVRTSWMHIGRFPLPANWVLARTPPEPIAAIDEAERVLNVLAGHEPAAEDPVIALPDGRRVRLLNVRVKPGVVELTCRTEDG